MKNKILIIDRDERIVKRLKKYLEENNEIIEVKQLRKGKTLTDYLNYEVPDFILLELSSIRIKELDYINPAQTQTLIYTDDTKLINRLSYRYYKTISKIYIKPFSMAQLNRDLILMSNKINTVDKEEIIKKEMSQFCFNRGSKGYRYMVESIKKIGENPNTLQNMEKELFPYLSEKMKLDTPENVKWSMQKLMVSMIRYTDTEKILEYFPYTKHPTLKAFLTTINEKISKENKM